MPNPTSKLNLVINGVTTQLDIHDANAVDLTNNQTVAGNKEFTGTTTAHDLVPSATDTYNFGSSTAQWNNAYIKSLTINGVACGDILTHNASEFVDVSSNQTIAGVKSFSDLQTISYGTKYKGNKDAYILPEFTAGYSGLSITTLSFSQTLKIGNFVLDDNNKPVLDTSKAFIQVATGQNSNVNACLLEPRNSTSSSLGSSTNKWKTFNGVEPSNLSLPSDTSINIDTTGFTWGRNFTFTPSVNGYLFINIPASTGIRSLSLKTGRGEYYFSNQNNILRFTMPVYKDKLVTISANSTIAETVILSLSLFPCQGNV